MLVLLDFISPVRANKDLSSVADIAEKLGSAAFS